MNAGGFLAMRGFWFIRRFFSRLNRVANDCVWRVKNVPTANQAAKKEWMLAAGTGDLERLVFLAQITPQFANARLDCRPLSKTTPICIWGDSLTPLMVASQAGQVGAARHLLSILPMDAVNARARNGQNALDLAVARSAAMVELLLSRPSIDVNKVGGGGQTPLLFAVHFFRDEEARLLLADPRCDLAATDCYGRDTLSICARRSPRPDLLRELIPRFDASSRERAFEETLGQIIHWRQFGFVDGGEKKRWLDCAHILASSMTKEAVESAFLNIGLPMQEILPQWIAEQEAIELREGLVAQEKLPMVWARQETAMRRTEIGVGNLFEKSKDESVVSGTDCDQENPVRGGAQAHRKKGHRL